MEPKASCSLSLNYLKEHDAFGSIVRGIHLWSAYILLFVIGLHMVRTFFSGSYKRPRELNWVTGVGLFVLVLGMAITGAFLPWDQAAYWTAVVVTNIPAYTPFIGSFIRALWRGADTVGPITLSRTFGIHVWLLPAILFPLIGAHLALLRKHGEFGSYINYRGAYKSREGVDVPPAPAQRPIEPRYPAAPSDELWAAPLQTEDFYPHQTFKDGIVSAALVVVVFILAVAFGAPLEAIADLVSRAAELGPAIEFLGYVRQRRNYDRLAHGLGRFITYYFSVSSTIAILLITVLLVGFWGRFWTTIVTIGWWPLFIEAWTFVLQVSLAYLWYYTWEPMRAFKGVHMAIGGLLAVASFLQVYMIDVIASYMLTPTNPQNPVRLALNPTSYPLTVHRTVGNLAYIGFAFGGFCAIRYLRAKTAEDKRFYDWAGSFGLLWGVSMTLLQPVVGYSYAKEIQLHSYGSWYKMMFGTLSPVFLWQITLLGIMFLTATLYFARRLRTDEARGSGILKLLSVGMLLTTLLAAQPYALGFSYESVAAAGLNRPFWEGGLINPLGSMIPWKVLALMFYTLIAIAAVVWYLRGLPGVIWGSARRGEQRILMLMAVLTMLMIVTMGFIRENSRGPFLISGEMTIQGQQDTQNPQPTPAP